MPKDRPNIILVMCDDLGYGDTGFNGNGIIRTPCLDAMRGEGARFTRFFAGGPVCSPTRGTCLTGRHYSRYGIAHANVGRLPTEEITLARVCKEQGYRTGHFGKWHLGTLTTAIRDSNRGGPHNLKEFSPPWLHGFETCFSCEARMPTWDPMVTPDEKDAKGTHRYGEPGTFFGAHYWNEKGEIVRDNLDGDDSRVIMDRAVPFIEACAARRAPFFATIWFHTPHTPVVAGPEYRAMYSQFSEEEQHYYGCITAMDEQVGRLNQRLKELGIEKDTMVWFCSDNGPEGGADISRNGRNRGVTGGLRGRKRSLFNGGIGVPALLKWPGHVSPGSDYNVPCSTLDYFPTVAELLGYTMPDNRPMDGISLLPMIAGQMPLRPKAIPYRFLDSKGWMAGAPTIAMIDHQWKFLTNLSKDGDEDMLFDIDADMAESANLVKSHPDLAARMRAELADFMASCRRSHHGADYPTPYTPINTFQEITGTWL